MHKQGFAYFPFQPELDDIPNIMADSGRTKSTVLELSHWPGNRTPAQFKADTSTQIALNFIASGSFDEYLATIDWVSSDHYDVDGLLSVWVLTQGKKSLQDADLLTNVATVGDFDKFVCDESLKSCLILYYFEQHLLQKAIEHSNWKTNDVTRFLYSCMFPMVADSLHRHEQYRHFWKDTYRQVQNDRNLLQSGSIEITEYPELDLAIIKSGAELSDFAVNERVAALRVLCIYNGCYVLRYRYESFVEMKSTVVMPRVSLGRLVARLNTMETNGTWFCEEIVSAHPKLQLYTNSRVPAKSDIDETAFVELVLAHFREMGQDENMQWHPSKGWTSSTTIPLPPSMREHGV